MIEIPQSDLLSVEQTAKILHCSLGTVRNLLKLGRLPALRFGTSDKVVRIHRQDVADFIDRQRQVAMDSNHKNNTQQ